MINEDGIIDLQRKFLKFHLHQNFFKPSTPCQSLSKPRCREIASQDLIWIRFIWVYCEYDFSFLFGWIFNASILYTVKCQYRPREILGTHSSTQPHRVRLLCCFYASIMSGSWITIHHLLWNSFIGYNYLIFFNSIRIYASYRA